MSKVAMRLGEVILKTAQYEALKEALQKPSASDRDIIRSGVDWRA
jgi:hypothetical protein